MGSTLKNLFAIESNQIKMVDEAHKLAIKYHAGQTLINGKDYYDYHILAVVSLTRSIFLNRDFFQKEDLLLYCKLETIAYLHDILEDCNITIEEIDSILAKTEEYDEETKKSIVAMDLNIYGVNLSKTQKIEDPNKYLFLYCFISLIAIFPLLMITSQVLYDSFLEKLMKLKKF